MKKLSNQTRKIDRILKGQLNPFPNKMYKVYMILEAYYQKNLNTVIIFVKIETEGDGFLDNIFYWWMLV